MATGIAVAVVAAAMVGVVITASGNGQSTRSTTLTLALSHVPSAYRVVEFDDWAALGRPAAVHSQQLWTNAGVRVLYPAPVGGILANPAAQDWEVDTFATDRLPAESVIEWHTAEAARSAQRRLAAVGWTRRVTAAGAVLRSPSAGGLQQQLTFDGMLMVLTKSGTAAALAKPAESLAHTADVRALVAASGPLTSALLSLGDVCTYPLSSQTLDANGELVATVTDHGLRTRIAALGKIDAMLVGLTGADPRTQRLTLLLPTAAQANRELVERADVAAALRASIADTDGMNADQRDGRIAITAERSVGRIDLYTLRAARTATIVSGYIGEGLDFEACG